MKNCKLILAVAFGALVASAVLAGPGGKRPGGHGPAPQHAHRPPARPAVHHAPHAHRPPVHHVVHHAPAPVVHHHHHHHPPHGFHGWRRGPIHAHYRNCWLDGVWYDEIGYAYYAPAGYVYQPTVVAPAPVVVAPAPAPVVVAPQPAPVVVAPQPLIQIQTN